MANTSEDMAIGLGWRDHRHGRREECHQTVAVWSTAVWKPAAHVALSISVLPFLLPCLSQCFWNDTEKISPCQVLTPGTRHDVVCLFQDSLVTAVDRRLRGLVGIRAGTQATRAVAGHGPRWKPINGPGTRHDRFRSGTRWNQKAKGQWHGHHGNNGPRSCSEGEPWLRELSFWRHDTNTPAHNHGVKLHKALPLGTVGRSLADKFSAEQICETRRAGRSGPVPNNAGSERDFCGVHFAHQQQNSRDGGWFHRVSSAENEEFRHQAASHVDA